MKKQHKQTGFHFKKLINNRLLILAVLVVVGFGIYMIVSSRAATHVRGDSGTSTAESRLLSDANVPWTGTFDNASPFANWGTDTQNKMHNVTTANPPATYSSGTGKAKKVTFAIPGDADWKNTLSYSGGVNARFEKMGIPNQDEVWLRYYYYPQDNLWNGGKLPGLGGVSPSKYGTSGARYSSGGDVIPGTWSGRLLFGDNGASSGTNGRLETYLYVPLMGSTKLEDHKAANGRVHGWSYKFRECSQSMTVCNNPSNLPYLRIQQKQWNYIELRYKTNTAGQSNGIFEGYLNGKLGVRLNNVQYRTSQYPDARANVLIDDVFYGGPYGTCMTKSGSQTSAGCTRQTAFFDDYVISKAKVGPRQSGGTTPPPPTSSPDLTVSNITTTPANPIAGQPMIFSATIKNEGTAATPAGTIHGVGFTVNGSYVAWSDNNTASLAPGATRTLTSNGGPSNGNGSWSAPAGTYEVRAIVDDADRMTESNEDNNTASRSITIATGQVTQPDLTVTELTWSPTAPAPGDEVTFSATIKNEGTAATPAGTIHGVAFSVNRQKVSWSDTSTASLAPGATRTLTANGGRVGVTWTAALGSNAVEAWVDDAARIAESNDDNNKLVETVDIEEDTEVPEPKPGDIDSDGNIDTRDLGILLAHYRQVGTESQGDLNSDGDINIFDLSILLSNWDR